jgi:hypothetical protein
MSPTMDKCYVTDDCKGSVLAGRKTGFVRVISTHFFLGKTYFIPLFTIRNHEIMQRRSHRTLQEWR